jgi:hypothetical protein
MRMLTLTNSQQTALVDDKDYEKAALWSNWHLTKQGYVRSNKGSPRLGQRQMFLHELILGACPENTECDHENLNRLDYRRTNLRYISRGGNQQHKRLQQRNNTSGFRGVIWFSPTKKWRAQLKVNGRMHYFGYFESKIDAAVARDAAARKFHGEFATLNFPEAVN